MITKEGMVGLGKTVKVKAVQTALSAVTVGIEAQGALANVRRTRRPDDNIAKVLATMYSAEDELVKHHPPATAELILTIVRENAARQKSGVRSPEMDFQQRRDDLVEFAFLSCSRGGEHAKSPKRKAWLEEEVADGVDGIRRSQAISEPTSGVRGRSDCRWVRRERRGGGRAYE